MVLMSRVVDFVAETNLSAQTQSALIRNLSVMDFSTAKMAKMSYIVLQVLSIYHIFPVYKSLIF